MASNYTENFGLCQWEATDAVLRTEFNEDNAKIDSVLSRIGTLRVLDTVTLASGGNSFDFDLSGVNWSACQFLGVTVDVPKNDIDRERPFICNLNQNQVDGHSTVSNNDFMMFGPNPFIVILLPFHTPERMVEGIFVGQSSGVAFGACTFGELTSLNFSSSWAYPEGTSATLWAVG